MSNDELNHVEAPAIEQLKSLGWTYVEGEQLSPDNSDERGSFREVALINRLETSIKRINPWINEENLRKVIKELTKQPYANLIEANQTIWSLITQYMSVSQDKGSGNRSQTVKIIDFDNLDNNEFLCTSQFKVEGPKQNIIPDIILFVNGLPLAVIECKSPYITSPMESGINQLLRYANRRNPIDDEGAERLFHYNQFMVSTHRDRARVGSITAGYEHYLEWKDPYPLETSDIGDKPNSQQVMIAGLFSLKNFLDLYQNFTVFEPEGGKTIKKIARYQQFRAVQKSLTRLKSGGSRKERGGVIWHTQGSGKSLTMVFLTLKIRRDPDLRGYKLVFITDRTQLDGQLTGTFKNTQGETVHNANSVKHLKELLQRDASDIITAMVQKFQESADEYEFPVLNTSEKIIILTDEAHRTQYGTLGAAINTGLPNAPKIAFTGTPLIKTKKTNNEFGAYIDTYTIEQSVEDESTVQLLYEGREPDVRVMGDSLDSLFDEYFSDKTEEEKAEIKRKYGKQQAILEAPKRIERICIDIKKHFNEQVAPNGFKGMIVTSSRYAAILYKEQMDKISGPESTVIISGDHNDTQEYHEFTDKNKHKKQIDDYKKPFGSGDGQSTLSLLIVKDMLLTGFDAPVAQVMYLDRKLADHGLLQAIARVNRTRKNKFCGYIVDYYGLSDHLTEALDMFSTEDVEGALKDIKDEIPKLKNAHTRAIKHFEGMNLDDHDSCILSLKDETKRQSFQIDFQKFSKQMDIVLPNPAANPFMNDLRRLGKISIGARNLYRDEQISIAGAGEKVRELIEAHVYSTGVDPKIPPISLFHDDFKKTLDEQKDPRTKAADIESAIKHHIRINAEDDPEYYKDLSKRLEEIIEKNKDKWELLVQLLLDFSQEIEPSREDKAEKLKISKTELAFYNILEAEIINLKGIKELDKGRTKIVVDVCRYLTNMIENATQRVDFFKQKTLQDEVKRKIKRHIIEHLDDVDLVKPVTERFMDLARVKFK